MFAAPNLNTMGSQQGNSSHVILNTAPVAQMAE